MRSCLHTYACVCVWVSVCVYVWSGWPGRLLYYFWESCPFPLEGLIEERWLSLSPPLRLRESIQARPSRLAGCGGSNTQPARAVACKRPRTHSATLHTDGWTAYWQLSITFSPVFSLRIRRIPPPLWKQTPRDSAWVLYPCVNSRVSVVGATM